MKKSIFLSAIMLVSVLCNAQYISSSKLLGGYDEDCGKWVYQKEEISEWVSVDTVVGGDMKTKERKWVEQEGWESPKTSWITSEYNPCGKDPSNTEYKKRVCSITGIIQERKKTQMYVYEEPNKTAYQRAIKDLKDRSAKSK